MASEVGTAYLSIIPSFQGGAKALAKELGGVETEVAKKSGGGGFGSKLWGGLIKSAKGAGVAGGAIFATSLVKGFGRLSAIEAAQAKLKGLGHTSAEVEAITTNALNSVKGTAYGLDEAAGLAGNLVASGIKPGKDLERILKLVGDSASISGREMSDMGLIWMQVASKGKLMGEDAMQLMEAGIPVWQMIGDEMGVTAAQAQDMASKGKVSFDIFAKAMEKRVGGAALESGKTTQGAFKNMNAALGRFGATLLKGVYPLIGPTFGALTKWIDTANDAVGPLVESLSGRFMGAIKNAASWLSNFRKILASDWITPDIVGAFGLNHEEGLGYVLKQAMGSVLAFMNAWKYFDGEVTSSGVPGFMEKVGYWARYMWETASTAFSDFYAGITMSDQVLAEVGGDLEGFVAIGKKVRDTAISIGENWKPILGTVSAMVGVAAGKMGLFGKAVGPLVSQFKNIVGAVKPFAPFLRILLGPIGMLAGAFGYMVATSGDFRGALVDLGAALGGALLSTAQALAPVVAGIGVALAQAAPIIGDVILQALDFLAPVLATVVDGFTWLVGALQPFLPLIISVGGAIFGVIRTVAAFTAAWGGIQAVISTVVAAVGGFFTTTIPAIAGFVAAIGWVPLAIGAAIGGLTWFFTQTETGKAILASVVAWMVNVAGPAIQSFGKWVADAAVWLWQSVLVPAWNGIRGAISAAIGWVVNVGWPALKGAWDAIAGAAMWLWRSVIMPAWTGIKTAIALAIAVVMTYVDLWVAVFRNVVAPVFTWLWRSVIVPVWNGIKAAISAVVSWFQTVAWPTIQRVIGYITTGFNALKTALGIAWSWIKNGVINPVISWFQNTAWPVISRVIENVKRGFNVMRDSIRAAWAFVRDRAINPVVNWFTGTLWPVLSGAIETVKAGFNAMRDAVGRAWSGLKALVAAPLEFVVNTVINDGLIKNFNKIAEKFGLPTVKEIHFSARGTGVGKGIAGLAKGVAGRFDRGGILPGYSRAAQGDDQLVTMRRGEGVLVSEALRDPLSRSLVYAINRAALRGGASLASFLHGRGDTPGYALGGIVGPESHYLRTRTGGWLGDMAGDTLDWMKDKAGKVWDFVSDPIGSFKGMVSKLWGMLPGAGVVKDLAKAAGTKVLDGVVKTVENAMNVFGGGGGEKAAPVGPMPPGASRSLGFARMLAASMGLKMTSFRRPGARTSSGSLSMHGLGRAMDFSNSSGPTPQMMAFFNAMHPLRPTELLYSPAGGRQWRRGGKMSDTSGTVKRIHYNHVHVAFAKGGVLSPTHRFSMGGILNGGSILGGYKPYLHDNGGWHLPGELSINQTRKPEAVLTAQQWERITKIAESGGTGQTIVNVQPPSTDDPGAWGRRVAESLDLHSLAGKVGV